ncbi:MAG: sensor domain-containing diguanylate cyclase [Egibacteraceae bacterium]
MGLVDVLSWVDGAIFCVVGVLAVLRWRRDRTHGTGAIAVAFVLLAVVSLADLATHVVGRASWLQPVTVLAFAGVGYAVLEHRAGLFGLATRWRVAAAVGLSAATAVLLVTGFTRVDARLSSVAALALILVWSTCMLEPAVRLWRAAGSAATIQSAQLRLLSGSYLALAALVLAGMGLASRGGVTGPSHALFEVAAAVTAAVLYLSLHAPRPLRAYWLRRQSHRLGHRLHPLPCWYVDVDSGAEWWSPSLRALLGLGQEDTADAQRFLALVHDDDRQAVQRAFADQLTGELTGQAAEIQYRIRRAGDGELRWVKATAEVLTDLEGGRALGLYGTLTDITSFKRVEAHLQQALEAAQRATGELSVLKDRFEYQSLHDSLTGLANRSLLGAQLDQAWAWHRRHGDGLVVLAIDLDGFKSVNDRDGHAAGDRLLIDVAHRLRRCVREADILARSGGDEFTVILPGASLVEAGAVADRMHLALVAPQQGPTPGVAGVSASIGIAQAAHHQSEPDDLLREADIALYAAKAAGKGRSRVYAPGYQRTRG